MQVQSLASLSGLRIWRCELWCRLQMWLGSCIAVAVVQASSCNSSSTSSLPYGSGPATTKNKTYHILGIYPDKATTHKIFGGSVTFFSVCFLGPHPRPMEVPGLGVELEVQLLAYATATATPDPSHVYDLHQSSRQRRILNPLREARD